MAGRLVLFLHRPAVALLQFGGNVAIAVFIDELAEQRPVELGGMHVFEPGLAAPLPMLNQIGKKLAAPADPAFEKAEAQLGEAPRHAAEEQRLRDGMSGGREMADMVIGEV